MSRFQSLSEIPLRGRWARSFGIRWVVVLILAVLSLGVTKVAAQQRSRNDVFRREAAVAVTTVLTVPQLDIKPGSCPNPVNPRSRGRIPVAIVGGGEFDVSEIDLSTIALTRSGDPARVYPVRASVEDVATPHMGDPCACSESGADGTDDLVLHFETQEIVSTLGLDSADEEILDLTVVGRTAPVREDGILVYAFELSASPGVPPTGNDRGGSCTVTLDEFWGDISVDCSYRDLVGSAISAHLHDATSILFPLTVSGGMSGVAGGTGTLTPAQVQLVVDGGSFVNIHTGAFPGGEIRGYVEGGSPFSASDCVRVLARRGRR